ncbi:hypothetical protein OHA25_37510 [Nonomuraea sp. NBC_00507]|uniref:hypothetical protein n=1 Tax=Nonomuraea sp. NBC_00507 TaxID=2976002 RepID=UPI002E18DD18
MGAGQRALLQVVAGIATAVVAGVAVNQVLQDGQWNWPALGIAILGVTISVLLTIWIGLPPPQPLEPPAPEAPSKRIPLILQPDPVPKNHFPICPDPTKACLQVQNLSRQTVEVILDAEWPRLGEIGPGGTCTFYVEPGAHNVHVESGEYRSSPHQFNARQGSTEALTFHISAPGHFRRRWQRAKQL